MREATLYTLGMGPGDPELLTLKAARIIAACPVIAYFAKRGRSGHARGIAAAHVGPDTTELRFDYPFTTEIPATDPGYGTEMAAFYAEAAATIALQLDAGRDVALLCEGDPFFYGSAMYLFDHLAGSHRQEIVPGVTGMSGGWTQARLPFTHGDDVLSVLSGTLDQATLTQRLTQCDAAVILKIGRNLPKVRAAVHNAGLTDRAVYVERATLPEQRVQKLSEKTETTAPYFSMVLVPGRQRPR